MFTIETEQLRITIASKGAELKSIFNKKVNLEYMWDANPAFWAKTSPVLFPIVGTLKDNTYFYNNQAYHLSRHGFARDKEFTVDAQSSNTIQLSIVGDKDTEKVYPFSFKFSIIYTVKDSTLSVTYKADNTGEDVLLFSVGGHPAFQVPLVEGTSYNDYRLEFNETETSGRWPITKDGLIDIAPQPLLQNTTDLPLTKELFQKDAIVLKHLQSTSVKLLSDKTPHGLNFNFNGFPYLGLWAAPGADFICIEPWCGIADSVTTNQQLADKEGIQKLAANESFKATWSVEIF